ncbi:hypothetical protein Tco_0848601 [Tanacetum coccineum]
MDPVIRCTTLPSHSRSLKGFLFHFSRSSIQCYRLSHSELDDIEKEILLKMNLSDHRIKLWWKWRYLVPVESIHSPMLTLNVFNQRQHDNLKTYNTAFATLIRENSSCEKEVGTFNSDQTSQDTLYFDDMTGERIDVIGTACEVGDSYYDPERDILLLESFLNDDPSLSPPTQGNYLPEIRKELKVCEAKTDKSLIDDKFEPWVVSEHSVINLTLLELVCERQDKWKCVLTRLIDDLLALDSKVRFDISDRRLELTATFSIPTYSE